MAEGGDDRTNAVLKLKAGQLSLISYQHKIIFLSF